MKARILLMMALFFALVAHSQAESRRRSEFNLDKGVALQGYDPVAYFIQHKAVKGQRAQALEFEGVVYYFADAANKERFRSNPVKYEPQYGGWCAFAMGDSNEKVNVDPETFKIVDGKLYLFYNAFFNNTLKSWNKNEAALKRQADANWEKRIKP